MDTLKLVTSIPDSLSKIINEIPARMDDSISVSVLDTLKVINSVPYYKDLTFYLSLITIIVAVLALFLPHIINKKFEKNKEIVRLKELEAYFFSIVNSLAQPIDKQIEFFNDLSVKIMDEDIREIGFTENSDLDLQNIKEIKHKDLYTIFIHQKNYVLEQKVIHFKNIFHTLNFINSQLTRSKENFIIYFNENRKYETDFRENIDFILRQWDQYLSFAKRNQIPPEQDGFLKEFDADLQQWIESKNRYSLKDTEENLLKPIKTLCQSYISDLRTPDLIRFVVDAEYAILNLRTMKGIYAKQFENEAIELGKNKKLLIEAINFFKGIT